MKLAEGEVQEHEYDFGGSKTTVLTNRRLIVTWGNAEHSYPISKIASVKIIFNRSIKLIIGGAFVAVIGWGVGSSNSLLAGLVFVAIGAAMIYFGWKGRTRLQIGQMGGNEFYDVRGEADNKLTEFIDMVNSKLS